jgi:predicted Ser/Thr protein kinase/DNA-binding beta-propeller fold protein YncE
MATAHTCPKCGSQRAGDALGDLCPACVGLVAFEAFRLGRMEFGDYQTLEEIARGGMGVVYKARQISLDRVVAVKMILSGSFAGAKEAQRFRAEAQIAARLRHPNIVAVYEIGINEGRQFFSMEYVEGQNLAQLAKGRPLAPAQAAQHVKIIAEAIHYAHQQGVLHRDLKPSNVLLDASGRLHITDFGLARQFQSDSDLTVTGQVLGTPGFMPPEQAAGRHGEAGPHNDIYSLGALLYFLLTSEAPFAGSTLEETLLAVLHKEAPSPRVLNPAVPPDLETICRKCLEKDPRRRYATAHELADELERFLRHEPIRARPIGPVARLGRWCRRSPATASLLISLMVTLAALVVVMTVHKSKRITIQPTPDLVGINGVNFVVTNVGRGNDCVVDEKTGRYWTPTFEFGGVTIRDGRTDTVITNIKLDGCPISVALDSARRQVWVDSQCGSDFDTVWLYDADTFKMKKNIRCEGVNGKPRAVNPVTGRFYHNSGGGPERIDPMEFTLTNTAFGSIIGVNSTSKLLYAQGPGGSIQIVDGATEPETILTNVTSFPIDYRRDIHLGISEKLTRIYVPIASYPWIAVLDGRSGRYIESINLQEKDRRITSIEGVAVDDTRNRVYALATLEGDTGCLYAIEGSTQTPVHLPRSSCGPVLDTTLNKIYLWMPQD